MLWDIGDGGGGRDLNVCRRGAFTIIEQVRTRGEGVQFWSFFENVIIKCPPYIPHLRYSWTCSICYHQFQKTKTVKRIALKLHSFKEIIN